MDDDVKARVTQGAHEALMKLYGRCLLWADGDHCFMDMVNVKACACGAKVSRSEAGPPAKPGDADGS